MGYLIYEIPFQNRLFENRISSTCPFSYSHLLVGSLKRNEITYGWLKRNQHYSGVYKENPRFKRKMNRFALRHMLKWY